jgi:hypothetical protein
MTAFEGNVIVVTLLDKTEVKLEIELTCNSTKMISTITEIIF